MSGKLSERVPLPWHSACLERLNAYITNDRIPHALMLGGQEGIGKQLLAEQFSHRLLCDNPIDDRACGSCHACKLIEAKTHPDLIEISPEEEGKAISIDRIRSLEQTLALKPHYTKYRAILINPAHALNRNASNALLKTLEEPGENTIFLLVTNQVNLIQATIRSRCQLLPVPTPERESAISWLDEQLENRDSARLLNIAAGSPLKAYHLSESETVNDYDAFESLWLALIKGQIDPVSAVSKVEKIQLHYIIEWSSRWLIELIQSQSDSTRSAGNLLEINKILKDQQGGLNLKGLFDLLEQLFQARKLLNSQLNRPLMLEELFINWSTLNR